METMDVERRVMMDYLKNASASATVVLICKGADGGMDVLSSGNVVEAQDAALTALTAVKSLKAQFSSAVALLMSVVSRDIRTSIRAKEEARKKLIEWGMLPPDVKRPGILKH